MTKRAAPKAHAESSGKSALPVPEQLTKAVPAPGARRPMTAAEEAMITACLRGGSIVDALGNVLLEQLELTAPEAGEAFVVALVAELEARARREQAWNHVILAIGGSEDGAHPFGRSISPVYEKLSREAASRTAPIRIPAPATSPVFTESEVEAQDELEQKAQQRAQPPEPAKTESAPVY